MTESKELNQAAASPSQKRRTLLVSHDVLGEKMAGPGIRYYHLSRILSRYTELTLAIQPQNDRALAAIQSRLPDVTIVDYTRGDWDSIKEAAVQAEITILAPYTARELPQFADTEGVLVIDGYDPLLIEWLTTLPPGNIEQDMQNWQWRMDALFYQYLNSDFFICASERQRYWWLGQLEVAGRINPYTFREDPSLRNLVDVVPYGLPQEPIRHTRQMVKGVWPGIGPDDIVLLWGGGLWPWLDPLTAIRAVDRLHHDHPRLKLIFPGTIHPNPDVSDHMPVRNSEAYTLGEKKGLLDKVVFFGEWVPYDLWPNVLLESDIALSLHHDTVETQLAFRSRMLEYIWAGVPMIATKGDATSNLVQTYGLGQVVDYENVDDVAAAILHILDKGTATYRSGFAAARRDLTWERAVQPLVAFCQNPRRAADRRNGYHGGVPYYRQQIGHLTEENRRLQELVQGYASGKIMRLLKTAHNVRRRLLPR